MERRCNGWHRGWFVVRNVHVAVGPVLVQPRYAMSLTRVEIRRGRGVIDVEKPREPVAIEAAAS